MRRLARFLLPASLFLFAATAFSPAPTASAQGTGDLGPISLDSLTVLEPSSVYRPFDMLGIRAGAHGWAMGGAYVSLASGIEGIAWNPAAMGWAERPELAADLTWLSSSSTSSSSLDELVIPEIATLRITSYDVRLKSQVRSGILGAGMPLASIGGRNLAGGVSFRRYMTVAYPEETVSTLVSLEGGFPVTFAYDGQEKGGIDAGAATIAVEAIPGVLSVGANLNILDGRLRTRKNLLSAGGQAAIVGHSNVKFRYAGRSVDLGLQLRKEDLFSVGLRYTPGYTLEVTGGSYSSRFPSQSGGEEFDLLDVSIAGYDLDVPPLLSVGGSVRPLAYAPLSSHGFLGSLSSITLAFGLDQQNWSEAEARYRTAVKALRGPGGYPCFEGAPYCTEEPAPDPSLPLNDVTSVHFGAEWRYLRIGKIDIPLRFGYQAGALSMTDLPDSNSFMARKWKGEEIQSSGVTMGFGVETGSVRYDLSYEIVDYDLHKFHYDTPEHPFLNPNWSYVDVSRRNARLRLSATLKL